MTVSGSSAATTRLVSTDEQQMILDATMIRANIRQMGWRLLSHTERKYGATDLHEYAFGHPNGSWVFGMGVNELMALQEVTYKIKEYGLQEGPLPRMPYQWQASDKGKNVLEIGFGSEADAEAFVKWLHMLNNQR